MTSRERVIEALQSVRDPETDLSIIELLLVNDVTVTENGKTVIVDMGFQRRNPDCKACKPLAWYIQGKIIKKIESVVGQLPGVEIVDVLSN